MNMIDLGAETDINKEVSVSTEAQLQADFLAAQAAEAKRLAQAELDRQADQANRVADAAAAELQRQIDLKAAPDACVWQRHADAETKRLADEAVKATQTVATQTVEAVKYVGPGASNAAKQTGNAITNTSKAGKALNPKKWKI